MKMNEAELLVPWKTGRKISEKRSISCFLFHEYNRIIGFLTKSIWCKSLRRSYNWHNELNCENSVKVWESQTNRRRQSRWRYWIVYRWCDAAHKKMRRWNESRYGNRNKKIECYHSFYPKNHLINITIIIILLREALSFLQYPPRLLTLPSLPGFRWLQAGYVLSYTLYTTNKEIPIQTRIACGRKEFAGLWQTVYVQSAWKLLHKCLKSISQQKSVRVVFGG